MYDSINRQSVSTVSIYRDGSVDSGKTWKYVARETVLLAGVDFVVSRQSNEYCKPRTVRLTRWTEL